jgi:hypothetical protein
VSGSRVLAVAKVKSTERMPNLLRHLGISVEVWFQTNCISFQYAIDIAKGT